MLSLPWAANEHISVIGRRWWLSPWQNPIREVSRQHGYSERFKKRISRHKITLPALTSHSISYQTSQNTQVEKLMTSAPYSFSERHS
jgi:hypothetical protein